MINRKLIVIHIGSFSFGGAGTATGRIHKALQKEGVQSFFINLPDGVIPKEPTFIQKQIDRIRFRTKKHLGLRLESSKQSAEAELNKLYDILDCDIATLPFSNYDVLQEPLVKKADIIHLHWVAGMLDYPSFFKQNKKPVVWTLHDMNPFMGLFHYRDDETRNIALAGRLDEKIKTLKEKSIKARRSSLKVIAPSHWLSKVAAKSESFKDVACITIFNTLDTSVFTSKRNMGFRDKYNIPLNNLIFLFVAESVNNHRKGFDLLLDAIKKIDYSNITLLVLGNSGNLNLEGIDIRSCGMIGNEVSLSEYYSNADAFIIPSREDNLPNVMLESLSCGTPVIGFPVGGIKEHITDFKTGILAKEVSSDALATAITTFYENKNLFDREEIRNYALEHFEEKKIAGEYIKVYMELLEN